MRKLIFALVILASSCQRVHATDEPPITPAQWEQIEAGHLADDEAEWAQWDAENADLERLDAELVTNPFEGGQ